MSAKLWNSYPAPIFDAGGNIASGAKAYFYSAGTNAPLPVYADAARSTPHPFPVIANSIGIWAPIYLPDVDYKYEVRTSGGVVIAGADNIANAPSGGGGGGGGIPEYVTGDVLFRFDENARAGFVRANGRTIGNASSLALERANTDCEALFLYLWNNFTNTECAVSGGRGSTAAADWAAAKTITLPDARGRAPFGLDAMGNSAANVIQASTTASVTNGSATVVVASAASLSRGMFVIIAGIASGTISAISGTTVTLNAPYAGPTAAGVAFRASPFPDAQRRASRGGLVSYALAVSEMPVHGHGVNETPHTHAVNNVFGVTPGGQFSVGGGFGLTNLTSGAASTGITIQNAGGGVPMPIIPPGIAISWFIKL